MMATGILAAGCWRLARAPLRGFAVVTGQTAQIMRGGRLLFTAVLGLICTACGGSLFESEAPVPSRYVIAAAPAVQGLTTYAALNVDLSIGRPNVAPGVDTNRIAVLRGQQLDYFRAAQWSGSVNEIVQALLVSSFENQRLFHSVTAEQARVSSDYLLDIDVRDFQAEYRGGSVSPQIRVTLVGRVVRIADRMLVDTIIATAEQPAAANHMTSVAAAFEAAAQEAALELARRTARAIAGGGENQ